MALGDYAKTTWVNGGPPGISAGRLNNIENKTEELDTAVKTHGENTTIHITSNERTAWNAKETPTGAQNKADAAESNAKNHTNGLINAHLAGIVTEAAANKIPRALETGKLDESWIPEIDDGAGSRIGTAVLTKDTAQVDFEALDLDTFAFLELIFLCKSSSTNANLLMRFNGDAGATNYSNQYTKSTGTTISAVQVANTSAIQITDALVASSDYGFTYGRVSISNILAGKNKEVFGKYNSNYGNNPVAYEIASEWKGRTSLITKISIIASSGSIATGGIFILLGVKK